jgi:8-oxo-dGTP diphosphatase
MRIIGVKVAGGPPVFSAPLPHGADPYRLAWQRGYRIVRPLSVAGRFPELTLTVQVGTHDRSRSLPPARPRAIDSGLELATDAEPIRRQRVAAYGIVLSDRGLLATQFSDRTAVPGLWGLPGGGLDPGETPSRALLREIEEETGQQVEILQLLDVQTDHWIGQSPTQVVEDFHAVRIIYAARCVDPQRPVVNDVGGTTEAAIWLDLDHWMRQSWSSWAKVILERHLTNLTADSA